MRANTSKALNRRKAYGASQEAATYTKATNLPKFTRPTVSSKDRKVDSNSSNSGTRTKTDQEALDLQDDLFESTEESADADLGLHQSKPSTQTNRAGTGSQQDQRTMFLCQAIEVIGTGRSVRQGAPRMLETVDLDPIENAIATALSTAAESGPIGDSGLDPSQIKIFREDLQYRFEEILRLHRKVAVPKLQQQVQALAPALKALGAPLNPELLHN